MAGIPVSVCMIAKNEEQYIEQCLRRLLRYNMEIIVVDTGSTDRTKEIAARYTDKLFEFEWCDDFSAARNFAVSKASNNWVLILDCDEYVQEIDVAKLRTCMQKYPKNVGVMQVGNVHVVMEGVSKRNEYRLMRYRDFIIEIIMSTDFGFMSRLRQRRRTITMRWY